MVIGYPTPNYIETNDLHKKSMMLLNLWNFNKLMTHFEMIQNRIPNEIYQI